MDDSHPIAQNSSRVRRWLPWVALAVLVTAHFGVATIRWNSPALIDHEFRQAQTAVIARYIDWQDNFSINYETPILGEPWEIPLEFPLYQWTVVVGARWLELPHVPVARAVSLVSFYLTVVALWLLLGSLGLRLAQRCWVVALLFPVPAFLFYSRSFLIDPFATMASAWFLAAFVRTMATRKWSWALLAGAAALAGALVKSVVFFVWLAPAAIWGIWILGNSLHRRTGGRELLRVLGWGVLPVIPSLVALKWWIDHTDAIKAVHPSGWIFTSKNLSAGNFGSFSLSSRFNLETWGTLFERWRESALGPEWVAVFFGLGLLGTRKFRLHALVCLAAFFVGQIAFPYAYALQDYYFYASAAFLGLALGFLALGWWDAPRYPRLSWVGILVGLAPIGLMARGYHSFYFQSLMADDGRDWVITRLVRELTSPESVFVVAGGDWSAVPTYQTHRRTLMIRRGLEFDIPYLTRAFYDLRDNQVGAMMFLGETKDNENLKKFAIRELDLDPLPTFRGQNIDVHMGRGFRQNVRDLLRADPQAFETLDVRSGAGLDDHSPLPETSPIALINSSEEMPHFEGIARQYRGSSHGIYLGNEMGHFVMGLPPPFEVWLKPPSRAGVVSWEVLLNPASYEDKDPWDGTDGVGLAVLRESPDGSRETLAWRYLDPMREELDRGPQTISAEFSIGPQDELVLLTLPGFNDAYDWALMTDFEIK